MTPSISGTGLPATRSGNYVRHRYDAGPAAFDVQGPIAASVPAGWMSPLETQTNKTQCTTIELLMHHSPLRTGVCCMCNVLRRFFTISVLRNAASVGVQGVHNITVFFAEPQMNVSLPFYRVVL